MIGISAAVRIIAFLLLLGWTIYIGIRRLFKYDGSATSKPATRV
jgi:hypothetical protein